MDASQRWETEALRSGSLSRKTPPLPPEEQRTPEAEPHDPDANWVTLKEAENATGIPLNTLRKWSRKSSIPSYLGSDGDLTLRMVDLDAVITHAHDLGRDVRPIPEHGSKVEETEDVQETVEVEPTSGEEPTDDATDDTVDEDDGLEIPAPPEGTLIVPIDAWNKMLNQLGNLHEAGQQLAEARERAAKAETEAQFLRERLADLRAENTDSRTQTADISGVPLSRGTAEGRSPDAGESTAQDTSGDKSTTSYWRYLTFGWRDRKRRSSNKE